MTAAAFEVLLHRIQREVELLWYGLLMLALVELLIAVAPNAFALHGEQENAEVENEGGKC